MSARVCIKSIENVVMQVEWSGLTIGLLYDGEYTVEGVPAEPHQLYRQHNYPG